MTFDLKYRPQHLNEYLGAEGMKKVLISKSIRGTLGNRSYLFGGPKGSGKTTIARWVSKAILCKNKVEHEPCGVCGVCTGVEENSLPGFDELDAAVSGSVDKIREIIADAAYLSMDGNKRIVIIDEAHRLNAQCQDVLLKALEDRVLVALFCTTEPEKIRPAIRSRLEEYYIRSPDLNELIVWARKIILNEEISFDENLLPILMERSLFCPRMVAANLSLLKDLGGVHVDNLRLVVSIDICEYAVSYIKNFDDKIERIQITSDVCSKFNAKTFLKEVIHCISLRKKQLLNISIQYPVDILNLQISEGIMLMIQEALSYPEINESVLTFLATKEWAVKRESITSTEIKSDKPKKRSINKIIEIDGIKYDRKETLTSLDDKIDVLPTESVVPTNNNFVEYDNVKVPMTEKDFGREYVRRVKNS